MEMKENSLDAYCVSHLTAAYTFKLPSIKSITVGATVYNLFNKKYETNGYSQTCAIYGSDGKSYSLVSDPRFYPMAGTNVLANVTLRF
jgi:iron complex outermembrane receptor protein